VPERGGATRSAWEGYSTHFGEEGVGSASEEQEISRPKDHRKADRPQEDHQRLPRCGRPPDASHPPAELPCPDRSSGPRDQTPRRSCPPPRRRSVCPGRGAPRRPSCLQRGSARPPRRRACRDPSIRARSLGGGGIGLGSGARACSSRSVPNPSSPFRSRPIFDFDQDPVADAQGRSPKAPARPFL